MCGIAGLYTLQESSGGDEAIIEQMNDLQKHRGPDDYGLERFDHCVLGHRRLSIIDLSRDGRQPLSDMTKRYWITYNGEIYNYIELRSELESMGWSFRTKTDTEVLLYAFIQFGENCLFKLNGMFALAIYDTRDNQLFLARDRFGIKPLYYFQDKERFYFASELKALIKTINYSWRINNQALFDYFAFKRTDIFDETFIEGVKRLPKGHFAILNREGLSIRPWWSAMDYLQPQADSYSLSEISSKIEDLFLSSVRLRLRSDVLVGCCLSGGLDSSILVGSLYKQGLADESFQTFTAAFPGYHFDETPYIDDLKKLYPVKNYRVIPTKETTLANLSRFAYQNDEPLPSAAFYIQYEVMALAKEHGVTVLLDGQGGDENFAGYHYLHGFNMYSLLRNFRILSFLKELIQCGRRSQHLIAYKTLFYLLFPHSIQAKIVKPTLPLFKTEFFNEYIRSSRIFQEFLAAPDLNTSLARHFQYKLEHLLRSEDRNSMAFSLECRVPYLDYRLVETILGLPAKLKIANGETKWLQKLSLGHYTTPLIRARKDKIGYGNPEEDWMKSKEWTKHTKQSSEFIERALPDIFHKDLYNRLPWAGSLRWQINHLASWYQSILKK